MNSVQESSLGWSERFDAVRERSVQLAAPLSAEDCCVQTMPDVSPTKWHLAHTSWFFESFLLKPRFEGYAEFHEHFGVLFNSYYEGYGPQHPRPSRGHLSRPSLEQVLAYREHVDAGMQELARRRGARSGSCCRSSSSGCSTRSSIRSCC